MYVPTAIELHIRFTAAADPSSSGSIVSTWAASHPAKRGAENDVPLQRANPLVKSSGSIDWRTRPSTTVCDIGSKPPWNGGDVLSSAAPGVYARTHPPALLNSASLPFGLSAPTLTIGTTPGSSWTEPPPPFHGASAAGEAGRQVQGHGPRRVNRRPGPP